jgi:putative DNA primase/helicase
MDDKELTDTIEYSYEHYGQNKVFTRYEAGDALTSSDYGQIIEKCAMSVSDLIKKQFPLKPTIIAPWLRAGEIGMIYSLRGIGKTWLSLLIGMAATRRLAIGKWETATPTGCMYLDGEMAAENLRQRLMDLSLGQPEVAPFILLSADDIRGAGMEVPNLMKENWRIAILEYLVRHKEIRLLIIDNLASLTPGLDENLKKDWDSINQWLLDLRSIGMAVIIVHHTGKSGEQRGTSAREDALDFSIRLSRDDGYQTQDGTKFTVEFTKARRIYGEDVKPFILYLHNVENRLIWEVVAEGPNKAELIKALLTQGKLNQKEIAQEVGVSGQYVTQVKKKTQQEEKLKRMELVLGDTEDHAEDSPYTEEVEVVEYPE